VSRATGFGGGNFHMSTAIAFHYNPYVYGDNMSALDNRLYSGPGWITGLSGGSGWNEWNDNYIYDAYSQNAIGDPVSEPIP